MLLALKGLRDTLRNPTVLTPDDLSFQLSSTLEALHIHPNSVTPSSISKENLKGISRYFPTIQGILLNEIIPSFYEVLDDKAQLNLRTFFVPPKSSDGLALRRQIAIVSYTTLPTFLNAPKPGQAGLLKSTRRFLIDILGELVNTYNIDDLYFAIHSQHIENDEKGKGKDMEGRNALQWEEALRSCIGIPAKIGNSVGRWNSENQFITDLPKILEPKIYFDKMISRLEDLMYELSQRALSIDPTPIRLVFEKLCSIGLVNAAPSSSDSRSPSLFPALLPPLLKHIRPPSESSLLPYPAEYLPSVLLGLPSSILASFVESLLSHLTFHPIDPTNPLRSNKPDQRIQRCLEVFTRIVGKPKQGEEAWNAVIRSVLSGKDELTLNDNKSQARNRLIVAWIATGGENAVKSFIETVIDAWTDPKYVKFALYAKQLNLTHVLLLSFSYVIPFTPWLVSLSHRSRLIISFQAYLSHPDASIRRLGMLVAEILTQKSQKKSSGDMKRLKFSGIWEGKGQGREECQWLRSSMGIRDNAAPLEDESVDEDWLLGWIETSSTHSSAPAPTATSSLSAVSRGRPNTREKPKSLKGKTKVQPKIVMLDPDQLDDPMQGYESSSPSSSRSPSPTPSYLEEVTADPSLALDATQKKKIIRPVYIPQLVALLKERDKPENIEMGLKWGESLIRAKREFGTELSENAVAVTLMTLGLNDPFNLEGFEEKRQGIMNALVACSPQQVAPFLCEQYFNTQYSLQQKSVILTALAMGARELAGLSIPEPTTKKIDFPSKTLPPTLHKKYLTLVDIPQSRRQAIEDTPTNGQLENTISNMRNGLLSKGARKGDDVPDLARERRLKVRNKSQKAYVAELGSLKDSQMLSNLPTKQKIKPVMEFKDIAAENFILPMINRFWLYYNDYNLQQSRSNSLLGSKAGYGGTGGGMILTPLGLEKFLITLSILLNASRHSSIFLSVLAPETLELALTLGIRFSSTNKINSIGGSDIQQEEENGESLVISSSLELILVILDISFELDKGRSLFLDKSELVLGIGEFATTIFQNEISGNEISGGQGGLTSEGRIKAIAAATVLKVGEIGEKWGGLSMI
uniref:Telomere length regulation protein conserved domain-containing protein n=1 Tax=Kwoniella pini CBS 10737 TaxID=1296096 RepID=A0A1B9I0V1_9TREE|nr:uncharacterized protein I206_04832 [Kwoniella pini CBS 10737]OCF49144.1 hypothetical protein I206_04832 [Kwoniella pini CBS 10737]